MKLNNFPSILINNSSKKNKLHGILQEQLKMPFKIVDFEKKIILLMAKNEFKKNSLIYLGDYIIDKNERTIRKNNIVVQLSEKEVNFLIIFGESKEPINRDLVLKNVWKYSKEIETHTIETHVHRLRKKILEKFNLNNIIKSNKSGYYI